MRRTTLTVLPGLNGPSLIVSKTFTSDKSDTMTEDEFRTFQLFMLHLLQTINGKPGLRFGNLVGNNDLLKEVLYFLYGHIASIVAPGLSAHEQLERTALALYPTNVSIPVSYYQTLHKPPRCNPNFNLGYFNPETWNTAGRHFFDVSVSHRINRLLWHSFHPLLNASLNADLNTVERHINATNPRDLPIVLSTKSTVAINHLNHLNIQRTGKPLQMALYSGDEDVVAYLKAKMDPKEFEGQSKEVFREALLLSGKCTKTLDDRNAPALNYYNAMNEGQSIEARILCSGLETTVSEESVAQFHEKLIDYVKNHPVHNPYILHRLYEIYESLPDNYNQDCLFSQKAIGLAHALSPARWLQHYARGIYYLSGSNRSAESPVRSFECRDTVNILSLVQSNLGIDSFISMFGKWTGHLHKAEGWGGREAKGPGRVSLQFWGCLTSKNRKLSELVTQPAQIQCCCSVM